MTALICLVAFLSAAAATLMQDPDTIVVQPEAPDISAPADAVRPDAELATPGNVASVKDAFIAFPASYLGILPTDSRLDMIDYAEMGKLRHAVRNAYYGESWIETYSPGYMKVHITDVSSLRIRMLKDHKGKNIVMAIYTVDGTGVIPDSEILFFDDGMRQLRTEKYFRLPDTKSFWNIPDDRERAKELKQTLAEAPFYAVAYTIEPEEDLLTGNVASISYLSDEQKSRLDPLMVRTLRFRWNGKRFLPL